MVSKQQCFYCILEFQTHFNNVWCRFWWIIVFLRVEGFISSHVNQSKSRISHFITKLLKVYLHFKVTTFYSLVSHSPEAADSSSFDVQLGDIILTATDGLFDNMPDYMILQELKKLKVPNI